MIEDPESIALAIWLSAPRMQGRFPEGSLIFLPQTICFRDSDALDIKNLFMNVQVSIVPVGCHSYNTFCCHARE